MTTRRANCNKPLAQERYASTRSGDSLLGNLVAKKCEAVKSAKHRRLILFLHDLSLRSGCRTHPTANLFPAWPIGAGEVEGPAFVRVARDLATFFPKRFKSVAAIPDFLTRLCLDPSCDPATATLRGCPGFIDLLEAYREKFCAFESRPIALTEAAVTVFETLDYALSLQGSMVLVEGTWRVGKSFSAQSWALKHLGECRYVQLSSARDDTAFYRDIARCLGTACSTQRKASEIRMRIEAMLRTQSLLLILDEAQYIFPQSLRPQTPPERVNYILSALLNSGVSVALIASHDFTRMLKNVEQKCPVAGLEQWHGRLKLRKQLPDALNEDDLLKIADAVMPEASQAIKMLLVGHALKSKGRIAAIESAVSRARFFAAKDSRQLATFADVERALVEAGSMPQAPCGLPAAPSRMVRGASASVIPSEPLSRRTRATALTH